MTSTPPRTLGPSQRYHSEELSPGVLLERLHPGGKDGPSGEVHNDLPGGQTWTEVVFIGGDDDAFQMLVPDIRLPANQCWPLHWHDTWTIVVPLEGGCIIGDWYMRPGDIFIAEPGIEYGPLLIGPHGCRLLEIFARADLAPGGYSPEYKDHPTLRGSNQNFKPRDPVNQRNTGRQVMPLAETDISGLRKDRLEPGKSWLLGEDDQPDTGVMTDTFLTPGEVLPAHSYQDWHFSLVLDGQATVDNRSLDTDTYLLIAPDAIVPEIVAGPEGIRLLELTRTRKGAQRQPVQLPSD